MLDELMVQEQISGAWQHMVAVIMLNQTGRKQVKTVLPHFLHHWPTAELFLQANSSQVIYVIRPLGMFNRRYHTLHQMTVGFLSWDGVDAQRLYGIGKYGSDSYEIFFKNRRDIVPNDHELCRYLGLPDPRKNQVKNDKNS